MAGRLALLLQEEETFIVDDDDRKTFTSIERLLGSMRSDIESIRRDRNEMVTRMDLLSARMEPLGALEANLNLRFAAIHDRFNHIQTSFAQEDRRIYGLEQALKDADARATTGISTIERETTTRMDKVEERLSERLNRSEMRVTERLDGVICPKIEDNERRIAQLEYTKQSFVWIIGLTSTILAATVTIVGEALIRKLF